MATAASFSYKIGGGGLTFLQNWRRRPHFPTKLATAARIWQHYWRCSDMVWILVWLVLKSWNHHSFVNISPTLVIDTKIERSSRVLQHGNSKIWIFSKKFEIEFWLVPKSWNQITYISPTIVIDTSIFFLANRTTDLPSRVLQHGNPKIWFFSKKFEIQILTCDDELKSPWLRQYQSYVSNWYINGKVFKSTTAWKA